LIPGAQLGQTCSEVPRFQGTFLQKTEKN